MNRRERFFGAVEGGNIDRVPVTVWMHFVTPYLSGEVSASRHCQFIKQYNWDLAKAVSDYRFPLPNGAKSNGSSFLTNLKSLEGAIILKSEIELLCSFSNNSI